MQQVSQCGDVRDVAEVVDHMQALFDLTAAQLRLRHQRAVLGVDVGPVDAADARPLRHVDGTREGPAVLGPDGHRGALLVALDVFGGERCNELLLDTGPFIVSAVSG
jgi:hypothetical protein